MYLPTLHATYDRQSRLELRQILNFRTFEGMWQLMLNEFLAELGSVKQPIFLHKEANPPTSAKRSSRFSVPWSSDLIQHLSRLLRSCVSTRSAMCMFRFRCSYSYPLLCHLKYVPTLVPTNLSRFTPAGVQDKHHLPYEKEVRNKLCHWYYYY